MAPTPDLPAADMSLPAAATSRRNAAGSRFEPLAAVSKSRWHALATVAVLAALLGGCERRESAPAPVAAAAPAEVETIFQNCVTAMVQSTCRVVNDKSGPPPPEAQTVFVAGVGPVDAAAYNAIRAAGDAMCSTVKAACLQAWDGPQCRTARGLWALAPQPR